MATINRFIFGAKVLIDGNIEAIRSISIDHLDRFVLNGRVDFERIPIEESHVTKNVGLFKAQDGQSIKKVGDSIVVYFNGLKFAVKYLDELPIVVQAINLVV